MSDSLGVIAPHPPVMLPEVGGARARETSGSVRALHEAREVLERFAPDAIVLSSPHAPMTPGAFLVRVAARFGGDLGGFGAPHATWASAGDPGLAHAILDRADEADVPAVALEDTDAELEADHGLTVPLWFLDPEGSIPVVEVSLSHASPGRHLAFGTVIAEAASAVGRRVAYVASGDLSHRLTPDAPAGYRPRAREFDRAVRDLVSQGDLAALADISPDLVSEAGECGLRSILLLAGFLGSDRTSTRVLHYECPFGVGYLTALAGDAHSIAPHAGHLEGFPGQDESLHTALARSAIEAFLRTGSVIEPPDAPELAHPAAAFVSLHRADALRGCIGTTEPTRPTLGHEIVDMAIHAATQDSRFPRLEQDELADLEISVDVLHTPEPVSDLHDLDPRAFGVIVSAGWRRGLLLPDLEGVDTVDAQVAIARRKAGVADGEPVSLERFRVERFT